MVRVTIEVSEEDDPALDIADRPACRIELMDPNGAAVLVLRGAALVRKSEINDGNGRRFQYEFVK